MAKKAKSNFSFKLLLIAVAVIVIGLIGYYGFFSSAETSTAIDIIDGEQYELRFHNDGTLAELYKGNPDAKAILIEYSDFQCPACQIMHERFKAIWRVVREDVLVVYRHYPLNQNIHARTIARMGEAMDRQDLFWSFHDRIFDTQSEWHTLSRDQGQEFFYTLVTQVGGDVERLKADLSDSNISTEIDTKIETDIEYGNASGLLGTPTLILNRQQIDIPSDLSAFVSDIKQAAGTSN